MRTGLFIAGVAVVVVGAGLLVSLFFLPGPPVNTRTNTVAFSDLGPNASKPLVITEAVTTSGSLVLDWNASAPVSVSLYSTVTCQGQGVCPSGSPLVTWNGASTGAWSYHGAVGAAYLLSVVNFGHSTASFVGSLTETYNVATPSQAVPAWALILIGGLFLLGIGGTAVFLGLFLEAGIYRPPRSGHDPFDREPTDRLSEIGADGTDFREV